MKSACHSSTFPWFAKELFILAIVIFFKPMPGSAQTRNRSFASVDLPATAHVSALGGVNVSLADKDVNYFQSNPALTSDTLSGWGSANYLFYFAGTGLSGFAYQHDFNTIGPIAFGVQHLSLGTLQGYDPTGLPTGTFQSGETAITIGKSHQVNHFRFGLNLRSVFSNLAGYRASALMADIGGVFIHPSQELSVGLVLKNMGVVLSEFSNTSTSTLPFDIQVGVTFKPEHMPLRFSLTAYQLNKTNLSYDNPNDTDEPDALDKVLRHFILGSEILIHKNVNLMVGYNFLRHKELKLENAGGGSGFSIGAMAKVKSLSFGLSRSGYVTGGAYQLSLNVNTNKIVTRK